MERSQTTEVAIAAGGQRLLACLTTGLRSRRVVIAANPSGTNRWCSRSAYLSKLLARADTATLLLDVMTLDEQAEEEHELFDVSMMAERLVRATDWVARQPAFAGLPIGYLGLRATVGAVIAAAEERPHAVRAVVTEGVGASALSRALQHLEAAALVIVDHPEKGSDALHGPTARQHGERTVAVIPGAGRPRQSPAALERVGALVADWFSTRLSGRSRGPAPSWPVRPSEA